MSSNLLQHVFSNWAAGQPDHWQSSPSGSENCIEIDGSGFWNDLSCGVNANFICEMGNDIGEIYFYNIKRRFYKLCLGLILGFILHTY